jgi:hypothetical protein
MRLLRVAPLPGRSLVTQYTRVKVLVSNIGILWTEVGLRSLLVLLRYVDLSLLSLPAMAWMSPVGKITRVTLVNRGHVS